MMKTLQENLFIEWDEFQIIQSEVNYLLENNLADNESEAWNSVSTDPDLLSSAWEFLIEELTEQLQAINPTGCWSADVVNFGWRKMNGHATFYADDAQTFLNNLLPKTDCTFKVYIEQNGILRIQNANHDSPTGDEWYTVTADVMANAA